METIRKSDVPAFLRGSALYDSLDTDGEFEVPVSCFRRDSAFKNEEELKNLLCTLRYWCVEIPVDVFEFLVWGHTDYNVIGYADEFEEFGDYFRLIDTLRRTDSASVAIVTEARRTPRDGGEEEEKKKIISASARLSFVLILLKFNHETIAHICLCIASI